MLILSVEFLPLMEMDLVLAVLFVASDFTVKNCYNYFLAKKQEVEFSKRADMFCMKLKAE